MKTRCIAFLARRPGLAVLRDSLLMNENIEPVAVFTHATAPKTESGGARPEFSEFQAICTEAGVHLYALEFPEARSPENYLGNISFDLIVSLSWRAKVPYQVLSKARMGGINLHRGALPIYAGAEPIRRALEANERAVAITAHDMTDEIDKGAEVARVWHRLSPTIRERARTTDPASIAEDVKEQLLPLYPLLLDAAVRARLAEHE